jgi:serine/threonine protein phosphatase 1
VVNYLIGLQEKCNNRNIHILGNHDQWFSEILRDNFDQFRNEQFISAFYSNWYRQGGQATYKSYTNHSDEEIIRHKELLYDNLELYHLEENVLYVHGGYNYNFEFDYTLHNETSNLYWDRKLFERALHLYNLEGRGAVLKPENKNIGGYDRIYIGHTTTSRNNEEPILMRNVVNTDQGGGWEGKLTIWEHGTDQYWQSDLVANLYPEVEGRKKTKK